VEEKKFKEAQYLKSIRQNPVTLTLTAKSGGTL
jgi:hypothetical protein